uniref:HMA domain-containing protein n=1 Tax=Ananas comosus var. bracteatus TaxID=296719 RepID=A0A6V7NJU4_ANACO|nr:unnamed protein product [Ananas comosus var. bracteatus]
MADKVEPRLPSVMQKTTFSVSGLCCASEAALVHKLLEPLQGIENVSINTVAKTVIVLHDPTQVPAPHIVDALNKAKLNANIRELGKVKERKKPWPSLNIIVCGMLLIIAMFSYIYQPLIWVALASIAVGIPGMLRRSIAAIRRFVLDINVLMVIATFGAIGLRDYLEGASIVFLFTFAEWLEEMSTDKARTTLESLINSAPRTAVIAETGEVVPVENIRIDTIVSVKAGEQVPVDGVIVSGESSIDERFINVAAKAIKDDSAVARMVKLVEDAQNQRSNIEEFIEKFAKYYTPGVLLIAGAIAIVPLALRLHEIHQWLYLSLILVVVACPCALVISTPVAKVCGLSAAAKMGLIIKGGSHLEALAKVKAMAFDKTGTLTEGAFQVVELQNVYPQEDINHLISSLENLSSHPMAKALVEYARLQGIEPSKEVKDFKIVPGEGIYGNVDGRVIEIGNAKLASAKGWLTNSQFYIKEEGITVGYVGMDNRFIGYFCLGDQIREEAADAVNELQKQGIHVTVLTGDSKAAARIIQQQIGENIEVKASLSPEGKMKKIAELIEKWGLTAMVGDGINDAPALATSDVGIAMGVAGSAVATETADVALMSNDLRKIPEAVKLARSSLSKVYQNVALSLIVKIIFFALAFGGVASLWAAVVADMGTSLAVISTACYCLGRMQRQ